ncbi:MAG: hypothetical protein H7831_02740 [Magnetococcus sp. WYHC-3]
MVSPPAPLAAMTPRGGHKGLVLQILVGVVLGLLAAEWALSLYLFEHEANHDYLGRDALVPLAGERLYGHRPLHVAMAGRYGSIPPHGLASDSGGFRQGGIPRDAPGVLTVLVLGASQMVGIGVADSRDLFAARLQERMEGRLNRHVRVFNAAQSGYLMPQIRALGEDLIPRLRPHVVLVSLPYRVRHEQRLFQGGLEVVNGYLLPADRPLALPWMDFLRTRSVLGMRILYGPLMRDLESRITNLARRVGWIRPAPASSPWDYRDDLGLLARLTQSWGGRMFPMPLGGGDSVDEALRGRGLDPIQIPSDPRYRWPGDGHWNSLGHAYAAEVVDSALAQRGLPVTVHPGVHGTH